MYDAPIPTESDRVEAWRLGELLDAGYPLDLAERIAARASGPDAIDIHQAVELVTARGCPPVTAAAIVL